MCFGCQKALSINILAFHFMRSSTASSRLRFLNRRSVNGVDGRSVPVAAPPEGILVDADTIFHWTVCLKVSRSV
jgi:hypothetical protein